MCVSIFNLMGQFIPGWADSAAKVWISLLVINLARPVCIHLVHRLVQLPVFHGPASARAIQPARLRLRGAVCPANVRRNLPYNRKCIMAMLTHRPIFFASSPISDRSMNPLASSSISSNASRSSLLSFSHADSMPCFNFIKVSLSTVPPL